MVSFLFVFPYLLLFIAVLYSYCRFVGICSCQSSSNKKRPSSFCLKDGRSAVPPYFPEWILIHAGRLWH